MKNPFKNFKIIKAPLRFPSNRQWKKFFTVLSHKEKVTFCVCSICFILAAGFLVSNLIITRTKTQPASGGTYREGTVGQQPRFINPLYLSDRDIDRDLVELIFSGLFRYNEQGEIIQDLASRYEIKEDGRVIEVYLKQNVIWHDDKPLKAADVIFTINLLQDPQYQSPLRTKWLGVVAEEIPGEGVRFQLPKQYGGFLENLTLKILPRHIFKDISPQNLPWSSSSSKLLIGSGPFKFKKLNQDSSSGYVKEIVLERNEDYYAQKPFLKKISFIFYKTAEELLKAVEAQKIQGFSLSDLKNFPKLNNFKTYEILIPRYFALFFNQNNQNNKDLSNSKVKKALALATNKNELIQKIFSNKGVKETSPILPSFFGFKEPEDIFNYSPQEVANILDKLGFKLNPTSGLREKTIAAEQHFIFKRNLTFRNKNQDVLELQKCLSKFPDLYPNGEINGYFGKATKQAVIKFQEKFAKEILSPSGLTQGNGEVKQATRDKLNEVCFTQKSSSSPLEITITTSDRFPLSEIADLIQANWQALGIKTNIKKVPLAELQTDVLAKRNFEVLLFGEALSAIPDPFPFWHSSQKNHPGLNIASYSSLKADTLLEKARGTQDPQERQTALQQFQNVLLDDSPALFLVRPSYIYFLSPDIKGFEIKKIIEPAKRFSTIEKWYIKTKRVWK